MEYLYFYGNKTKGHLPIQEDAYLVEQFNSFYILMVADANGGQAGQINAGQLMINMLRDYLHTAITSTSTIKDIPDILDVGFYMISRCALSINTVDEKYSSLYTSLSVAVISEITHDMAIGSIGNSEIQLISGKSFKRLNEVHSEAAEALKKGEIEEYDFYSHPGRAILTSTLGINPNITVDIMLLGKLNKDDVLLLVTDGVNRYLTPPEVISTIASKETIQEGVDTLLKKIDSLGGEDNAAIIVGHVFSNDITS